MWIRRRMDKSSRTKYIANEEVLGMIEEEIAQIHSIR